MEEVGALCTRLEDCDALTSWLIGGLNINTALHCVVERECRHAWHAALLCWCDCPIEVAHIPY